MKIRFFSLLAILAVVSIITGCAGNGMYLATNETNVNLEQPNYRIVATNVTGYSSAGYVLGMSFSMGAFTETFALTRVSGTGRQYNEALENFWENFEAEHGPVEGRSLGLINVRYDADVMNALVYTEARVYVTADVVEFE